MSLIIYLSCRMLNSEIFPSITAFWPSICTLQDVGLLLYLTHFSPDQATLLTWLLWRFMTPEESSHLYSSAAIRTPVLKKYLNRIDIKFAAHIHVSQKGNSLDNNTSSGQYFYCSPTPDKVLILTKITSIYIQCSTLYLNSILRMRSNL